MVEICQNTPSESCRKLSILQPLAWPYLVTAVRAARQSSQRSQEPRIPQDFASSSVMPLLRAPRIATELSAKVMHKFHLKSQEIADSGERNVQKCGTDFEGHNDMPPAGITHPFYSCYCEFSARFTHSFTDSQPLRPCFNQGHVAAPYLSKCP